MLSDLIPRRDEMQKVCCRMLLRFSFKAAPQNRRNSFRMLKEILSKLGRTTTDRVLQSIRVLNFSSQVFNAILPKLQTLPFHKRSVIHSPQVFDYFGTMEISEPYAIQLKAYDLWLKGSKIPDETSAACKMTDCERVFISSNYEYDKNTLESEINDDNSLTRFEFIEAIIRLAVAKYGDASRKLK